MSLDVGRSAAAVSLLFVWWMASTARGVEVIVDNNNALNTAGSAFAILSGGSGPPSGWRSASSASGYYGTDYTFKETTSFGGSAGEVEWRPSLPSAGQYEVYVTWGQSSSGDSDVTYTLNYQGGSQPQSFNMRNVGQNVWHQIGAQAYPMNAGVTYTVVGTNPAQNPTATVTRLMADAVFFRNPNGGCTAVASVSVQTPVLTGDTTVTVTGVDPAATVVKIYADGVNVSNPATGTPTGGNTTVVATTTALPNLANINATQTVGGQEGCPLQDGPEAGNCNQIGPVTIGGVLLAGDPTVPVSGVHPLATAVRVYKNGNATPIGSNTSPGGASTVNVSVSGLIDGDLVTAIQEVRGLAPCTIPPAGGVLVGNCNQVPAVSVVGMVDAGRTKVRVKGVSNSATNVTIYANDAPIVVDAAATAGTTVVTVPALVEGQTIKATQKIRIHGCLPATGRRVMAAGIIEDFQELTTNQGDNNYPKIAVPGNPPLSGGVERVWYNAGDAGFMATTGAVANNFLVSGNRALRWSDNGGTNGLYAIYDQIVPDSGEYHLEVGMLIDEATTPEAFLNWMNQFQVGLIRNGVHRTPAATIASCAFVGNYTGPLTAARDSVGETQTYVVLAATMSGLQEGDNLLIAFSYNVTNYSGNGGAAATTPGMWIDNIKLNVGPKPCLPQDVPQVQISKGPLEAGGTTVNVLHGLAAQHINVYAFTPPSQWVLIGSDQGSHVAGEESNITVTPLVEGKTIVATQVMSVCTPPQTMEGVLLTTGVVVGSGKNSPIRLALGIRETGQGSGTVGSDGGNTGTLEWVGAASLSAGAPQGKLITPSADWQTVTFSSSLSGGSDPVLAFPGSGNGTLAGAFGVLEHLAFATTGENTGRYIVYIDNVVNGSAGSVADFEGATDPFGRAISVGGVALFRTPNESGSTSANLLNPPAVSAVDDQVFDTGARSLRVEFQFKDNTLSRWLRLTSVDDAAHTDMPYQNPLIDLSQPVSVRLLIIGCPALVWDADEDDDVDLNDFAVYQTCFDDTGVPAGCACLDVNGDDKVDRLDLGDQTPNTGTFVDCASRDGVPSPCLP